MMMKRDGHAVANGARLDGRVQIREQLVGIVCGCTDAAAVAGPSGLIGVRAGKGFQPASLQFGRYQAADRIGNKIHTRSLREKSHIAPGSNQAALFG